jgi:hypothetical protein
LGFQLMLFLQESHPFQPFFGGGFPFGGHRLDRFFVRQQLAADR